MSKNNSIGKTIRNITAGVGLGVATVGGISLLFLGANALAQRHSFNSQYSSSVQRPDGLFGTTELEVSKSYSWGSYLPLYSVSKDNWYDNTTVYDGYPYGACDGLVDKILKYEHTFSSLTIIELERSKDYNAHKAEFDNADKLLSETVDRLGKHIKPLSLK